VDAHFDVGTSYVVGTGVVDFGTSACSVGYDLDEQEKAALRDPSAGEVAEAGLEGADPPIGRPVEILLALAVLAVALGFIGAVFIAGRRLRSNPSE
jgi:hypothetical protein